MWYFSQILAKIAGTGSIKNAAPLLVLISAKF